MPSDNPANPAGWDAEGPRQAWARVTDPVLIALLDAIKSGAVRPSEAMALTWDHLDSSRTYRSDDASVTRAMALADASHGAEGVAVIDPYARELARWVAEGRMSGDEAVAFITALIDAGAHLVDPDMPPDPGYEVATAPLGTDPPGEVKRGDSWNAAPLSRSSESPKSEAGDQVSPVTVPAGVPATEVPSDSLTDTLSDRIGPFYDTGGLRDWFQISSETVDTQVQSGELLALVTADGFRLFPAFQMDEGGHPLPHLREVLAELDPEQVDPWGAAVWLNAASEDLGGLTPAAALRIERADDVIRLARQAGTFRLG